MKLKKLFFIALCGVAINMYSQSNINDRPLRPDWVSFSMPDNDTFFFKRISISAKDVNGKFEADQLAQRIAFQAGADYLGYFVNTRTLNSSIKESGDALYIDSDADKKIAARLVCEYQEPETRGSQKIVTYWYLYEISKSGRKVAQFDTDFDCSNRTRTIAVRDSINKVKEKQIKAAERRENGIALVESMFLPGLGQMCKHRYGEGSLTLIGELVLVGGGTGCYFLAKNQLNIMHDKNVEYLAFNSAQSTYNTMRVVTYTCYGAAAALYMFNLYRAYAVTSKKPTKYAFYPTIIPTENNNLAMGVGMSVKF